MKPSDDDKYWDLKEIIDPYSGERTNKYFYKRKKCKSLELDSKLAQQLAGYSLIEKDLRNILIWIEEIEGLHKSPKRHSKEQKYFINKDRATYNLVKGLFVASLTFYGKCFASCEGRRIKLEKRAIDKKYLETHETYMNLRHQFAAHSGADKFEEVKVVLVLPPNKKAKVLPKVVRELRQPDIFWSDGEDGDISFKMLVQHVRSFVLKKIDQLTEKILTDEVLVKGKNYWYAKKG